ncbi:unnamed protein product [Peronospora belbahrii]|uniref:FYVE-type domain-containing protein n=1 Tax=Peronospora belbahrii TaxID=622444 RepID=A0ABN8DEJ6_9STRA|nr:unnamed protein product [Peronospora belbahrii]
MSRAALLSSRVSGLKSHTESINNNNPRIWTPLRENHFEAPQLSTRERAYLVRKSCEAAQELVGRARSTGGPITWHHVEKHNGVQLYAGSLRPNATRATALPVASMCGVTSVPGTMQEVALLFELSSTRQMKEFARAHREWFYDGIVLHTLAPRTKEKPLHQVTAKWMVMQMPDGVPHRDFCYLECQDKFIDAKGRKGWVLGQHSIKLPGVDDLKQEFGFVRGSLYNSGLVVVESEERPGYLDVIYLVQLNLKDRTPVPMSLLRSRVLFVAQVRNMLRSKRLNEQRYLSDLELVPRKYRSKCAVCQDSFSLLLLRKMSCRKCGEVVCAACSKDFPIENRNFAATNGGSEVRKLRICMHCFQAITNAPKPTSALVEPPHSSTISMSFLGYCDDNRRASLMTSQVGGKNSHREEEAPKIFLQSMRRKKPSSRHMSSTSPILDFGNDVLSSPRYRTQRELDAEFYQNSRRYQQQDYGRSYIHRGSERLQSSDFRPSQSLSLDDPIARGAVCYTLQMPGSAAIPASASIFDRPMAGAARRHHDRLPRSNSNDIQGGSSNSNMSSFGQFHGLSSRERLEQLQREDNYMSRSSIDNRMPDAFMSGLQQAGRDNHVFDVPPTMYQAPPSDFGAYGATSNNSPVTSSDFGPYGSTLDDLDGCPPLDMNALTSSPSAIPIEFDSMSTLAVPSTVPRDGGNDGQFLCLRELEVQQRRESTSSDSSANSIDIDTYEDLPKLAVVPPIPEQVKQGGVQCYEKGVEHLLPDSAPSNLTSAQKLAALRGSDRETAWTHDIDEDSETSMGASDDEEERRASVKFKPSLMTPPCHRPVDVSAEETKARERTEIPVLSPSTLSARTATHEMLERPSIAYSSVLGDLGRAEYEMTDGVKPSTIKETKVVAKDLIGHDHQLLHSKVEDLTDLEYHQIPALSKQSEVQVADEKQIENGVQAKNNAREQAVSAVPFIPSKASNIAAGEANGEVPLHGCTATSPRNRSGMTPVLTNAARPISSDGNSAPGGMNMKTCQNPLNNRNDSENDVVLGAQKEAIDMNSPTPEYSTRRSDSLTTGGALGLATVETTAEDLIVAGAQQNKETARFSAPVIAQQDLTTTYAPSEIPIPAMLPVDNEKMQASGDGMLESCLHTSSRISSSSFSSGSARGSNICSMGLDPISPPATPPSATSVPAVRVLPETSASSSVTVPALDLAASSPVRASESAEVVSLLQSNIIAPPPYLPRRFLSTEQLQEVQQNISTEDVPFTTTPVSTLRQCSDSNAALDNFQRNISTSFDAHQQQQQKAQTVSADGVMSGLSHLIPSDGRNDASSSGSNDIEVIRYQSVGSFMLDPASDTNEISTLTSDDVIA